MVQEDSMMVQKTFSYADPSDDARSVRRAIQSAAPQQGFPFKRPQTFPLSFFSFGGLEHL
jgi:hypothetical protein